uniref:Uncharacterized protein n=1 Tax=Arundo donax TaxID=35708 RepID=A0A0A8ZX76_ARUDO
MTTTGVVVSSSRTLMITKIILAILTECM